MTFLELCKETRRESGSAADGPSSVANQVGINASLVGWVKLAYRMVVDSHSDWTFLWTRKTSTVLGSKSEYSKAELGIADAKLVWTAKVVGGTYIKETPWMSYRSRREDLTDVGTPVEFTFLPNGDIAFYPWPEAGTSIRFEYQKVAPDLKVDGDIPLIPAEYQDAIVWQAVLLCATDQENPALQNRAAAVYNERYDLLNRDYRPRGPYV
jgi:hypothetical protein